MNSLYLYTLLHIICEHLHDLYTLIYILFSLSSARLKELGPMKIKPTLVGFSGEYKAQCCVLFS